MISRSGERQVHRQRAGRPNAFPTGAKKQSFEVKMHRNHAIICDFGQKDGSFGEKQPLLLH